MYQLVRLPSALRLTGADASELRSCQLVRFPSALRLTGADASELRSCQLVRLPSALRFALCDHTETDGMCACAACRPVVAPVAGGEGQALSDFSLGMRKSQALIDAASALAAIDHQTPQKTFNWRDCVQSLETLVCDRGHRTLALFRLSNPAARWMPKSVLLFRCENAVQSLVAVCDCCEKNAIAALKSNTAVPCSQNKIPVTDLYALTYPEDYLYFLRLGSKMK
jgi:hypothetical protein